jgi:hypothetical protein
MATSGPVSTSIAITYSSKFLEKTFVGAYIFSAASNAANQSGFSSSVVCSFFTIILGKIFLKRFSHYLRLARAGCS